MPEIVKEEIVVIEPGVLQEDIQPILEGPRAPERATPPPEPVISKIKKLEKDTIVARVFFEFELAAPSEEAKKALDEAVNILNQFPENKVVIEGNTCAFGDAEINKNIASSRAWRVYSYLIEKGVDETRLTVKSYAYKKPVMPNDTTENRAHNRRVDVIILK